MTRPLLYSRGSQFSCIPFRLSCQAWGLPCATDTAASKEFTGFCNAMQTSGEGRGVLPVIPHQILTRKSCFPCSVHSIHHTEVSNDSTCLFKKLLDMRASAALQDCFTIFPHSLNAMVPSTWEDII